MPCASTTPTQGARLLVACATLAMAPAAWAVGTPPTTQSAGAQTSGAATIDRSVTPDQVTTSDGSILQGTVRGMLSGKLSLENEFADNIQVDQDDVVGIITSELIDVVMYDSRRLRGALTTTLAGAIVITPADGGATATVNWAEIDELWELPPNWDASLTFGFSENSGNSQTIAGSLGAHGTRNGEHNRFTGTAAFSINQAFGESAVQKASGSLSYSHYLRARLYLDATEELLHDHGQDLTIQAATHFGVGYDLVERPKSLLSFEAGTGVIINRYSVDTENDDTNLSFRGAMDLKIPFGAGITLTDHLVFFLHDSRHTTNTLAVTFDLGSNWKLKVKSSLQVSSDPSILADRWDHQTVMGLTYSF